MSFKSQIYTVLPNLSIIVILMGQENIEVLQKLVKMSKGE